jgi:hypothetical protein
VGVKGRYDSNPDAYADPNNEFWSTATANDCGYAQAGYGKLDYPETIGGYTVTLNAGGVAVSQSGSTTSGGGTYDWPDAVLTYDANGCPNGIDLGEPVWTCNASEEVCNEVRQFLDANPPEINLRRCYDGPCTCTQNSLGSACGVSYISVTTEFSFARCGGQLMSREFTLNAQNGWQHIIREPDQQGTLFVARALVFCFQGLWRLTVDANAQGGPCFFVCDTPLSVIGGIGGTILLPTIQNGSHCCPSAIQSWLRDDADCPGSRLAVTNMSIVLA